jgi:hypothetical protein
MTTKRKPSKGPSSPKPSSTASSSCSSATRSGSVVASDNYQVVVVTLSDGRQGCFVGLPLVTNEPDLVVTNVKFYEPRPLPGGAEFVKLDSIGKTTQAFTIGNWVYCNHAVHGCIGRFDRTDHTFAVPDRFDDKGYLLFNKVEHKSKQLRHHWAHFVDHMAAWGLDVRDKRPKYVEDE